MTDNINKRIADALVECGYAISYEPLKDIAHYPEVYASDELVVCVQTSNTEMFLQEVTPFADTLEGRRQLEALFDYFAKGMSPICHFDYQCLIPIGLQMRTFVTKCIEDAEKSHD